MRELELFRTLYVFSGAYALLLIFFPFYYFFGFNKDGFNALAGIAGFLVLIIPVIFDAFTSSYFAKRILMLYAKICYIIAGLSFLHFVILILILLFRKFV
ncbi:MAG: hypothetical protein LBE13_09165 [Bacteroidales bacterium]|jgi:hypothetical protein|nr:hypothetical protein [Bacteroidales bacterium]